MSCTIEIDDRGIATLSIPDADGECHAYLVRPLVSALSAWCCAIERTRTDDGKEHGPYRVALEASGAWTCTCGDCKYRGHKRPCKHIDALRPLYRFLSDLLHPRKEELPA